MNSMLNGMIQYFSHDEPCQELHHTHPLNVNPHVVLSLLLPNDVLGQQAALLAFGAKVTPSRTMNTHLLGFQELLLNLVLDQVDQCL